MEYTPMRPIWLDNRENLCEYSSDEMLCYYRSAVMYCSDGYRMEREAKVLSRCRELCAFVDTAIGVMKCDVDYRIVQMANLIETEFCKKQLDITSKLECFGISKTTYYTYLRDGRTAFARVYQIMMQ